MKGFVNGLLDERLYSLTVNGRSLTSPLMLSGMEKEFAYGYLKTEGIISPDEIESVMLDGAEIGVLTANPFKVLLPKKTVVSGCGGTASYLDAAKLPVLDETIEPPALPESLDSAVLQAGGFAAVVVSPKGFFPAEDVGQSAAIDKAVGSAILSGADLKKSALALSGKVTADMVKKALNAGISVIASGYPATNLAAETAAAGNVTLVPL
ncbi:MAG: hypothetical protein E7Z72_05610 [Methanocorpusculum parvum]|nr:hypothetical protein [Methanocorpusculum parvum]